MNKKILWATPNTLFDTTNGAAIAVKEILSQLVKNNFEIKVLGGTITVNPRGMIFFKNIQNNLKNNLHKFITINDNGIEHTLLITKTSRRRLMLSYEEQLWFDQYCKILDEFKPDMVWFFDKSLITLLTAYEAKIRDIKTVVYLAQPNNRGNRWNQDVDFIITDSKATAAMYKKREGYDLMPVGAFINPLSYKADTYDKKHILFINPSFDKGVSVVIQLALLLEKNRPDITFEIVESKSHWSKALKAFTGKMGAPRDTLSNVVVTPNTKDMKPVYSRAKILLVPSLWWESAGRVIIEAMLNSIPVIGTNRGGIPEMIGEGGFIIDLPNDAYVHPYDMIFKNGFLNPVSDLIQKLYDDKNFYESYEQKALKTYEELHNIDKNTEKLIAVCDVIMR